jgi:hypothetical protein
VVGPARIKQSGQITEADRQMMQHAVGLDDGVAVAGNKGVWSMVGALCCMLAGSLALGQPTAVGTVHIKALPNVQDGYPGAKRVARVGQGARREAAPSQDRLRIARSEW